MIFSRSYKKEIFDYDFGETPIILGRFVSADITCSYICVSSPVILLRLFDDLIEERPADPEQPQYAPLRYAKPHERHDSLGYCLPV